MQHIELILSMLITIFGFIASTVTYAIKFWKAHKMKTIAENTIEIKIVLLDYIIKAENLLNKTGEQKKEYVVTKVKNYANDNKLVYDETKIDEIIDKIVNLTKQVNIN